MIVAIHGGAFMGCDKGDLQVTPMLEGLKKGFAVVSINYRMSGEANFPALVNDAKAAVRWIRASATQYGFDPSRIISWAVLQAGTFLQCWQSRQVCNHWMTSAWEMQNIPVQYRLQSTGLDRQIF